MPRKFGLRRKSITPFAKAVEKLDRAVSNLVRQHYEPLGCFTCNWAGAWKEADCGHFRRRECMSTRFDLRNLGLQSKNCNRFEGGRSYEMAKKLDEIWGKGTAELMERRARTIKQWEIKHLEQLTTAARLGWLPYLQLYNELHP